MHSTFEKEQKIREYNFLVFSHRLLVKVVLCVIEREREIVHVFFWQAETKPIFAKIITQRIFCLGVHNPRTSL